MNKLAGHIESTQIRYRIPTSLWLRLRWLCRDVGCEMSESVIRSLAEGLDAQGVPEALEELLALRSIPKNARGRYGRGRAVGQAD